MKIKDGDYLVDDIILISSLQNVKIVLQQIDKNYPVNLVLSLHLTKAKRK